MLWTSRYGFEPHLYEELAWAGAMPLMLGPALVEADARPGALPAFGRAGFRVLQVLTEARADGVASRLSHAARGRSVALHAWAVDTPKGIELTARAQAMGAQVRELLGAVEPWVARERGGVLGQICFVAPDLVVVGIIAASEAASLSPGGQARMHRGPDAPSRAALKLDEALSEASLSPGRGDVCVDLGAAPGGWTQRLLARGARVIAVDPAKLAPQLRLEKKLAHFRDSAFKFHPDGRVDWLLCDMAWRPQEVASLLAKWGRKGWAVHLLANLKLPMEDKNAALFRARYVLEHEGQWRRVAMRQLYHDRNEVTVTAQLV